MVTALTLQSGLKSTITFGAPGGASGGGVGIRTGITTGTGSGSGGGVGVLRKQNKKYNLQRCV